MHGLIFVVSVLCRLQQDNRKANQSLSCQTPVVTISNHSTATTLRSDIRRQPDLLSERFFSRRDPDEKAAVTFPFKGCTRQGCSVQHGEHLRDQPVPQVIIDLAAMGRRDLA